MLAADVGMLRHYGIDSGNDESKAHRVWRTVTPAVLPQRAARRRIDPGKLRDERTRAKERTCCAHRSEVR